jgi:hypothetical protein
VSDLTPCNYDTYQRLIEQYGADRIRLKGSQYPGWIDVEVAKEVTAAGHPNKWEPIGVSFMAISPTCIC